MTEEKNEIKVNDIVYIDDVGYAEVTEVTINKEGYLIGFKCKLVDEHYLWSTKNIRKIKI